MGFRILNPAMKCASITMPVGRTAQSEPVSHIFLSWFGLLLTFKCIEVLIQRTTLIWSG